MSEAKKPKGLCDFCYLKQLSAAAQKQGRFIRLESLPTSTTAYFVGQHTFHSYKLAHCMDKAPSKCECRSKKSNPPAPRKFERDFQAMFKVSI
jgi:hypothetical protein